MRRLIGVMVASAVCLGPAARAEENRIAVHFEVGPMLTLLQPELANNLKFATAGAHIGLAFEYSLHERVGLEFMYSPDILYSSLVSLNTLQQHVALGVRLRPWFSSGYLLPTSPHATPGIAGFLSDVWIDVHAGVALANANAFAIDAGAGTRVAIIWPVQVGLFVRYQHLIPFSETMTGQYGSGQYGQLLLGVELSLGFLPVHPEPDSDGDGVPDSKDRCPNTPEGTNVNAVGCPMKKETTEKVRCSDSDLDGVCDGSDDCADTPLGTKVDKHGCPADAGGPAPPERELPPEKSE